MNFWALWRTELLENNENKLFSSTQESATSYFNPSDSTGKNEIKKIKKWKTKTKTNLLYVSMPFDLYRNQMKQL